MVGIILDIQDFYDMRKRKEEERKPRQEAVVKSITPDQPAPVVERRPVETTAATSKEEAAEGFLLRLFGLFRKKYPNFKRGEHLSDDQWKAMMREVEEMRVPA